MSVWQVSQLCVFAAILSAGQILFKRAADTGPALSRLGNVARLFLNGYVWAAFALYGAATLFWIYLLQLVPLSRAYPFAALSFVLVPGFAWALLGETVGVRYLVGVALIVAGTCLSAYG